MGNRRRSAPIGQGRASVSLGASDPSLRRNAEASLRSDQNLGRSMRTNPRTGKLEINPARLVADLPAGASTADVVSKVNEMLRAFRDVGQMKGK